MDGNVLLPVAGECAWLHLDLISNMLRFSRELYPSVGYAFTCIPTYPSGQIGLVLCGKAPGTEFWNPVRSISFDQVRRCRMG